MTKKSKRPRLQTTVASDIVSRSQFTGTHSSNTATRTRQMVTTVDLEPTTTEMDSEPFTFPETVELDLPAGVEVLTNLKAQRYVNSVRMTRKFGI
jgi:hypothetical protein